MKMDSTGSDHSEPLSDNQAESWLWENDDSSVTGLTSGTTGLHDLVEDKEMAARAVAFVVSSTRKGIVPLCADVANLLRSKKALEKKVMRLKCENDSLRSSRAGSVQTSHSTSPPASINSYSDRGSQPHERSSRPCSRCSSRCSSLASSNSPKFDKSQHQRSPQLFRSSSGHLRRSSADNANGNHQVAVALIHAEPSSGGGGKNQRVSPSAGSPANRNQPTLPSGGSPQNHDRKGSLPQITCEPHASVPKVSPQSQKVSAEVQCDLQDGAIQKQDTSNLEEQCRTTLEINAQLEEELGTARKEIEMLRASLKELEMKHLAHQCLEEFELECQSDDVSPVPQVQSSAPSKDTPLVLPVLQRGDSIRSSRSSKQQTSSPVLIPSPLDGCSCRRCKDQPATQSTLVIPPKNGISQNISGRLQLELGDHVVVRGERTGHVCYIGHLNNFTPCDAIFVGLELDAPVGSHDGAVNGHRYYKCSSEHGAFVPLQDILCIIAKQSVNSKPVIETSSVTIDMEKQPPERASPASPEKDQSANMLYPARDTLYLQMESVQMV